MVVCNWGMDTRLPAPDSLLSVIAPRCHSGSPRAGWQAGGGEKGCIYSYLADQSGTLDSAVSPGQSCPWRGTWRTEP